MPDRLSDQPSVPGALVLNHGDPTNRPTSQSRLSIKPSEDVFLRIISYLPFAETIIVPGRHMLDGMHAFDATVLAQPLLREGLLIPERRSGPSSFEEVARTRSLGSLELERAKFLDKHARTVREFRWDALSSAYRETLLRDLAPTGAFRRVVPGGIKGRFKNALDIAYSIYEKSGSVLPEGFISAVEAACPQAAALARRWAMAHYYLTPARFDDVNVRQMPREAANLLIRGRSMNNALRPPDGLAPAEYLLQALQVGLGIDDVRVHAAAYCEAALKVRQDIPQARQLFKKIILDAEARDASQEVSAAMERELTRQLKRRLIDRPLYSLSIDLAGGIAAAGAGLLIGSAEAVGLGAVGAGATSGVKYSLKHAYDKYARPWRLAIDTLKESASGLRSERAR